MKRIQIAGFILALAAPAFAADALRDAAHAAIALKKTRAAENGLNALEHAYDASPYRPTAEAPLGRWAKKKRRIRFPSFPSDLRDAPNAVAVLDVAAPSPEISARIEEAARTAFTPWRKLLDYAWNGAWTGAVSLRSWQPYDAQS